MSALALFNEVLLNNEDREGTINAMLNRRLPQILAERYKSERYSDPNLIRKQLVYVQCWTLHKYQKRMNTPIQDKENLKKIKELIDIAFPDRKQDPGSGTLPRQQRISGEYKNLGFESILDPKKDFDKPPGELALQVIYDFATRNPETFTKTVMDYNCHGCPFARCAIGLVKVICQVLGVGEDPRLIGSSSNLSYYHFVLAQEDFMQEMFEICIGNVQLFSN